MSILCTYDSGAPLKTSFLFGQIASASNGAGTTDGRLVQSLRNYGQERLDKRVLSLEQLRESTSSSSLVLSESSPACCYISEACKCLSKEHSLIEESVQILRTSQERHLWFVIAFPLRLHTPFPYVQWTCDCTFASRSCRCIALLTIHRERLTPINIIPQVAFRQHIIPVPIHCIFLHGQELHRLRGYRSRTWVLQNERIKANTAVIGLGHVAWCEVRFVRLSSW